AKGAHLRKGAVGSWKDELPEQVARDATAMLQPLLERLGYQDMSNGLSPFLMRGELSSDIMAVLAQINALQLRAGERLGATPRTGAAAAHPASTAAGR